MTKELLLIAALLAIVLSNVHLNHKHDSVLNGSKELSEDLAKQIYEEFESPYNTRSYYRFKIFYKNLKRIIEHNKGKHSWTMGINDYADSTKEEIQNQILMVDTDCTPKEPAPAKKHNKLLNELPPKSFDWRNIQVLTEPKNQGYCGATWAFAAVGSLQSFWNIRKMGIPGITFAEQQLIDCSNPQFGCSYGTPASAFVYVKDAHGIVPDYSYPYVGKEGKCRLNLHQQILRVTGGSYDLPPHDEDSMVDSLYNQGPITHGFNVIPDEFAFYRGGIYQSSSCKDSINLVNHFMLAVGYGLDEKTGQSYWVSKNSWGAKWGEGGYVRITRGVNMCDISLCPSYPVGLEPTKNPRVEATA